MNLRIRILLVDDHQMLRDGLKALIDSEDDMQVIAEASNGIDGIELSKEFIPDVVVMDLGLPGMSGMEAIRALRSLKLDSRIVVLSMHNDPDTIIQAIKAGADGFVPKSTAHSKLMDAIRVVHAGERYLHPLAASAVVDELSQKQQNTILLEGLSDREKEVLRLIALGFTSREIGEQLSLSPKTVDTYRQRAMLKLDIDHRSDIVLFALRAGLLKDLKK